MNLITALLRNIFGAEQCGGTTSTVSVSMTSPEHCAHITRYSTCGGDATIIRFNPPLPLAEALLHSAKYTIKGSFEHK